MTAIADALRKITATMQAELEAGRRSTRIDAHDLIDLFLAIADEIDPPLATTRDEVDSGHACPGCGERNPDQLVWQNDEVVRCSRCNRTYTPNCPGR